MYYQIISYVNNITVKRTVVPLGQLENLMRRSEDYSHFRMGNFSMVTNFFVFFSRIKTLNTEHVNEIVGLWAPRLDT